MYFGFKIDCPGSEVHDEPFEVTAASREEADSMAATHVTRVFAWASPTVRERAKYTFVGDWPSKHEYEKAMGLRDRSGRLL